MSPVERNLYRRARNGDKIRPQEINAVPLKNLCQIVTRLQKLEERQGDIFYAKVRKQRPAA